MTWASTCTRCWVTPALVSKVAMCISKDASGRSRGSALLFGPGDRVARPEGDAGVAEEPEGGSVERLEQPVVQRQTLAMEGDQAQGGLVAVAPRVDHEAIGERRILPRGPAQGGAQLLLAEGDRVIRDHGISGGALW